MRTLKLTIAYDGTAYGGWQRQENADTIQGHIEAGLADIEGRCVTVYGAGRTDAGVHAFGQVASFTLEHLIDTPALLRALNAKLPLAIRVLSVEEVDPGFHAQYAAKKKHYRYRIDRAMVANPIERRYAWHVRELLDISKMAVAARMLVGRHDFSAFQTGNKKVKISSTFRTIFELGIQEESNQILAVDVEGSGFLRYMVRAIVGTLVEIGTGRLEAEEISAILDSSSRHRAGPTAPAHGLFLMSVDYREA